MVALLLIVLAILIVLALVASIASSNATHAQAMATARVAEAAMAASQGQQAATMAVVILAVVLVVVILVSVAVIAYLVIRERRREAGPVAVSAYQRFAGGQVIDVPPHKRRAPLQPGQQDPLQVMATLMAMDMMDRRREDRRALPRQGATSPRDDWGW